MRKAIYLFLISLLIISIQSCGSSEKVPENTIVVEPNIISLDSLQQYFPPLDFSDNKIYVHHWAWADENNTILKGNLIPQSWLKKHLENGVFRAEEDEEYYGLYYIKALNSLLIRKELSFAAHMQQTFLLVFDEKKGIIQVKKIAGFFGAEGFINQSASWIVRSDSMIEMTMRDNIWTIQPEIGETSTDSIHIYHFENNTFAKQSTKETTSKLKKQFPFIDE